MLHLVVLSLDLVVLSLLAWLALTTTTTSSSSSAQVTSGGGHPAFP